MNFLDLLAREIAWLRVLKQSSLIQRGGGVIDPYVEMTSTTSLLMKNTTVGRQQQLSGQLKKKDKNPKFLSSSIVRSTTPVTFNYTLASLESLTPQPTTPKTATIPLLRPLKYHQQKMSAPNAGRQSPSPERQSGAQQQDPPSSATVGSKKDASDENKQQSEEMKNHGLSSNPKGPLEDAAEQKLSKDGRGDIGN